MRDLETLIPGDRGRYSPPLATPGDPAHRAKPAPTPPDSWPRTTRPQGC